MTLTSMNILVATFSKKGRWAKAENVQVQVIEAIRKILGGKSSRIMTSINLASSYRNQGRWVKAEKIEPRRLGFACGALHKLRKLRRLLRDAFVDSTACLCGLVQVFHLVRSISLYPVHLHAVSLQATLELGLRSVQDFQLRNHHNNTRQQSNVLIRHLAWVTLPEVPGIWMLLFECCFRTPSNQPDVISKLFSFSSLWIFGKIGFVLVSGTKVISPYAGSSFRETIAAKFIARVAQLNMMCLYHFQSVLKCCRNVEEKLFYQDHCPPGPKRQLYPGGLCRAEVLAP